jgi:fatty acid desaturase
MNDLDDRLIAALRGDDDPPERDPAFRLDVMVRRERARFRRHLLSTLALVTVTGVLLAVGAPAIATWVGADVWRAWIVAIAAALAVFAVSGVSVHEVPGLSSASRSVERWLSM